MLLPSSEMFIFLHLYHLRYLVAFSISLFFLLTTQQTDPFNLYQPSTQFGTNTRYAIPSMFEKLRKAISNLNKKREEKEKIDTLSFMESDIAQEVIDHIDIKSRLGP
jgi:hypothetical protein